MASPGREGATSHLFPPASDAGATTRRGELGYSTGRPSIWRWRDHSADRSASRATPMPCGSRPSMAALTRSGARKASEIVMLIFRVVQPSQSFLIEGVTAQCPRYLSAQFRIGISLRDLKGSLSIARHQNRYYLEAQRSEKLLAGGFNAPTGNPIRLASRRRIG